MPKKYGRPDIKSGDFEPPACSCNTVATEWLPNGVRLNPHPVLQNCWNVFAPALGWIGFLFLMTDSDGHRWYQAWTRNDHRTDHFGRKAAINELLGEANESAWRHER